MVRIATSQEPAVVLQRCEARLTTPQIKFIRRDSRLSAKGEEGGDDEDGQGEEKKVKVDEDGHRRHPTLHWAISSW